MLSRLLARHIVALSALLASSVGLLSSASAQTPAAGGAGSPPTGLPINQTFLNSDNGWIAFGGMGKVSVAAMPIALNSVHGALQLDYSVGQGDPTFFALQVAQGALANARKFRFAVRSETATTVAFGLQENDGGRYMAFFAVPKDKWQVVELTPRDFILSDGPTDPKDPDNRLDLDQVNVMGLVDVDQILGMGGNPAASELFGVKKGPHKLYLADLSITGGASGGDSESVSGSPDTLDAFAHPQVDWLLIGGAQAENYDRGSSRGRGLSVKYTQQPAKPMGLMRNLHARQLVGATRIAFSVASVKAATLLVQVEETDGGKYNATVYVPAGAESPTKVSIPFADFKEADDSKDTNHKLDLDQVNHLIVIDATGMMGGVSEATPTSLYLADLHILR